MAGGLPHSPSRFMTSSPSQSAQKLQCCPPILLTQAAGFTFLAGVLPRGQAGARTRVVDEDYFDRLAE
jgi:hypothetical protein